ncbi:MAG: alpha/beta hydrolase [Actinobacteria bacterium]|nr:alpha/beta hydrolase [Actinomycetota bacterium]
MTDATRIQGRETTGTTFVLVPGAGADPRVYGATIGALRDLGHDGIAPPLPLDHADALPSDHAAAIVAAIRDLDQPAGGPRPASRRLAILGQSLGAFSASLAADRLRPDHLILLAPMIPKPGETADEWWAATRHAEAIASLRERFGPPADWDEEAMAELFYHDVDEATLAASAEFEGVPGTGLFEEPFAPSHWPFIPTTVLVPRDDRMFPLEFQRRVMRERLDGHGIDLVEMEGGHLPMLSRPRALAERLVEIAG